MMITLYTKVKYVLLSTLVIASLASGVYAESVFSPEQLSFFRSEEFGKQLAQSFISETDIEPLVTAGERESLIKIMQMITDEKNDEAIATIEKNRKPASSAVFDFTLANIYFQQEKYQPAIEGYLVAVEKFPKFRRAWKNLAMIYVRQGDYERAIPALTRIIELGDYSAISFGLLGFSYSSIDNSISAESAYRMAVLLDGETLDWKMGLAKSYFKQQRYADAVAMCEQLIKNNPDNADMWFLQANAWLGQEKPLKAAEIYELVDAMGKSTGESLCMLGDIYINQELFTPAVDSYIKAVELASDKIKAERLIRSSRILIARGALDETENLLAKIENVYGSGINETDKIDLLKIKARLAMARGAGQQEVQILEQIVALNPLDGDALILLGQNAAGNKDDTKAIYYYEMAANIEKYEADAKVRHAQLLVSLGRYNDALPLLRQAQQVKPRETVQEYLEKVEKFATSRK